jgi:serine/threonine protein phosphatase PrpC
MTGVPALACTNCGAGPESVDSEGFCTRCGFQRIGPARDHVEIALSPDCAGVSDRGKRHPDNEDFFTLTSDKDKDILVVCDGVSSSQNAAAAALAAGTAARDVLGTTFPLEADTRAMMMAAIQAAQSAVAAVPYVRTDPGDPPETTFVAVLRRGRHVTVGWLGDSRAYLVSPGGVRQLTEDHSWLNEVLATGQMSRAEALRSPQAHSITRTLGGPTGASDEPSLIAVALPEGPGYLILCSDGLWNALPEPDGLADLVGQQPIEGDALNLARSMVDYANAQGGRDNVTVAVLRF